MLMPSRIALTWLQVFALTLPGFPTPVRAQQSPLARVIHRTTLDNGLEIVVAENNAVPLATVLVAVRNGAFTQEPAERGLAHLYEHVLFRSYKGDPNAFGRAAGRLNAAFNGFTSSEVVSYFLMVPSQNVDGAIDLMAGLFQDARFSNQDLKEERPIVLNELQRHASDPEDRLGRQVAQALWGSSWSRKDASGDSVTLAGITLDHLKATYSRSAVPTTAAIIVTGGAVTERVVEQARERFRDWKRGPDPFADRPIPPIAPRATNGVVMLALDVRDVTIRIALQGPSVGQDTGATYAADALFDLLNDPTSGFQQRLVTNGPFESVTGTYYTLSHSGPIEIVGKTSPERAQDALVRLLNELETLDVLEGVSDEDLAIAKKHREVQLALTRERIAGLAPALAQWWSSAGLDYHLAYDGAGIRVLQRRTESSDIVAVRLYLLGGTRQITERTAGIEPLMLRAAAYHGGRALDRTGSVVALEPEADWTVYGFTGLVEDLDATWRAFVDRLVQPEFSDAAVAGARRRLLTQARRRYTEPDQRLRVIAMRALFRDHPYALDPEGTEASLAALTAEDVRAYARDQLVTSRMLLAVVGAVTRAHVESLVTVTLGRLPRGDYRWTLPPAPRKHTPGWLIENRDLPTAYILGLFPGPPPTAGQAYWAFRVATAVL